MSSSKAGRIILFMGLTILLLTALAAAAAAEEGAKPSEDYGQGTYVAYVFNDDYTAYGIARGEARDETKQRAVESCGRPDCVEGESAVISPGCIMVARGDNGKYFGAWDFNPLSEEKILKKCQDKLGAPCRVEVSLCSN